MLLLAVNIFDFFTWRNNVWHNLKCKSELLSNVRQNNALCIYGGIGSGKSTIANFLVEFFIPKENIYYNTKVVGKKAFTNEYLLLKKKMKTPCGVLVDESGAQADSFHYNKDDTECRQRIEYLNKFFRQWYGDDSLLIYIDQCQGNNNTSIYKNIYYVIQCQGVQVRASAIVPHLIAKLVLLIRKLIFRDKKKINNPFSLVCINYMEFFKLGDYAEHYSVNINERDYKCLVGSIYRFFGVLNTYVFREFNPAIESEDYIWGSDSDTDKFIMENNFRLSDLKEDIKKNTMLRY